MMNNYRQPFWRPRPFFGAPFLGGFAGGLLAGALIRPPFFGYPYPYPYPYPYYPYYPFY
ncbi:hypothetical protein IC621_11515 [Bacillus sp. IB182487]|uniref:Spore coat protein n=2 Tax=Metabacillus arenae TaxID=2771434 RepID=A0A926NGW8_9BACI|nr:hypothetical protein [Metabacillus arenae]